MIIRGERTTLCTRKRYLEKLHIGTTPVGETGDYSDVKVIDGQGREIPWTEVSHVSQDEMRKIMKQVVNRLYTWFVKTEDLAFHDRLDRWLSGIEKWDDPEFNKVFLQMIAGEHPR